MATIREGAHAQAPDEPAPLRMNTSDARSPEDVPSRPDPRAEHITATGWRVKGAAIPLVAAAARAVPLEAAPPENALGAVRLRLRPRLGRDQVVAIALHTLTESIRAHWLDAPPLRADAPLTRPAERLHGLWWDVRGATGAWVGELRWRHPHPTVRAVPCLTHVVLQEQLGLVTLSVRVSVEGGVAAVRGLVGAGQAMPTFLRALRERVRMTVEEFDTSPQLLDGGGIEAFVREVLLSERRAVPVFVLAPQDTGGYHVEPEVLADELVGLGPLYVMDRHATTFALTDALGDKRLSCFYGALRVYLPGFSCADEPRHHPLILRDRLVDPVERLALIGQLAMRASRDIEIPLGMTRVDDATSLVAAMPSIGADAAAVSDDGAPRSVAFDADLEERRPHTEAARRVTEATDTATDAGLRALAQLGDRLEMLMQVVQQLLAEQRASRDELTRVRTSAAVRAASTASLERRFGALEQLVREAMAPSVRGEAGAVDFEDLSATTTSDTSGDEDEDPRLSLREVLQQAAATHDDALLVLDAADRAAGESPYEDIDRVALVLDAMAVLARRRMEGGLGVPLREAFREHGIDYRSSISSGTPDRLLRQYRVQGNDGGLYDCREHIVLGNAYDPRYCLRIYFTSRHPGESRFVIGHVGRHFDVKSTT